VWERLRKQVILTQPMTQTIKNDVFSESSLEEETDPGKSLTPRSPTLRASPREPLSPEVGPQDLEAQTGGAELYPNRCGAHPDSHCGQLS